MKKILSIILALVMLLTASVATVSAATAIDGGEGTSSTGNGGGDYTLGVGADYVAGVETAATVISVDIAWESMEFTYIAGSMGTWDATNHQYTGGTVGGWADRKAAITVTNHSNASIKADFSFAAGTGITGLKGVFTNDYVVVESADSDSYRTPNPSTNKYPAPSATTSFGIDPTSSPITEDKSILGTITVSIKKVIIANTELELDEAFDTLKTTGGMVILGADLDLTSRGDNYRIEFYANSGTASSPLIFDLGGHTVSGWVNILGGSHITIQNGTINATRSSTASGAAALKIEGGGVLELKNMTISANTDNGQNSAAALYFGGNSSYTVTIDNSELNSPSSSVSVWGSDSNIALTLKNNVTISDKFAFDINKASVTLVGGGTYSISNVPLAPENDLVLDPRNSDHRSLFL